MTAREPICLPSILPRKSTVSDAGRHQGHGHSRIAFRCTGNRTDGAEKDKKNDLADVIVYTDGIGAKQTKNLKSQLQATIRVVGSPVSNVANTFLSCTKDSSGDTYTVASGVTNYSDHAANMEITLYEGKKILEVRTLSLAADETYTCLFKQVNWGNQPLHTELSAVTFAGSSQKDSLHEDNCAYALKDQVSTSKATLIGEGNTYIEKRILP